jgi:hypothetical protein
VAAHDCRLLAGEKTLAERLVLNHSGSGVTAGYLHGHALDLKRELLDKWAKHVEGLVSPSGRGAVAVRSVPIGPVAGFPATSALPA